ncbi:MAG TPA: type IV pilus assembly protein PilM [Phycisphaerae bacterium]|nr:type IV pilus assembly protein PilM [Phycisphaerae bacterium]HOJ73026.1 type IV pilus assembly protein PilM [Phycisphaerae bacterium]HOM50210.1 type IV pilus assembly protein PilM [Phycisphaerae bacterium]HON65030.1 type IV pilus assembly protein PilM [Phycisphaerae bacterium]HOQ86795.1 type IV pilus assembly protein PilM [Phycisphaerae bacterium]
MAASKPVWGIDLGQCALKAIRVQPGENGLDAIEYVYIEHPKILSQPDVDRTALVEEAMKKFLDQHDLSKETIVVGVPGQHTLARFSKLPPVDKKKIPEIVKYEAQQQIPFDMDEVIWDYQTFTSGEGETEVGIFAMRRELLRNHLHFVAGFNLEPAAVQSGPLALYNALVYDGIVGSEPVAILDIGTQNADLIVVEGGSLWTRNIPIGGNNFTEALSKTFKVSFRKAENLKRDAAKSKYARQIFQAMRPVFADLVAEVQRSIGFFTSSRRGVRLNKVIAMGAAFKLPGLQKFLQQNLGMDIVRPAAFNKLNVSGVANAPVLVDNLMSFGVAYGLALQGLGQGQITSNLLPPEIAKQVVWRRKTPWFYGAAACLVLSSLVVWGRTFSDASVIEKAKATGTAQSFNVVYDPNDKEQTNPKVDPNAIAALNSATIAGATPVDRATTVINLSNHFDEITRKLLSMNDQLISEADRVASLHAQKSVWPAILRMIHSALPVDPQLNQAMRKGPEAYRELIASNPEAYARPKRKQIFITGMTSEFTPDVMSDFNARRAAARRGAVTGDAPSGEAKPGFIITMTGQTTHAENYEFVKKNFFANLEKAKDKEAYVAAVQWVDGWSLSQVSRSDTGPVGFAGGARTVSAGEIPSVVLNAPKTDPVTKESTATDWAFQVVIAVVLGEKPAPAPADGGAG